MAATGFGNITVIIIIIIIQYIVCLSLYTLYIVLVQTFDVILMYRYVYYIVKVL